MTATESMALGIVWTASMATFLRRRTMSATYPTLYCNVCAIFIAASFCRGTMSPTHTFVYGIVAATRMTTSNRFCSMFIADFTFLDSIATIREAAVRPTRTHLCLDNLPIGQPRLNGSGTGVLRSSSFHHALVILIIYMYIVWKNFAENALGTRLKE